MSKLALTAVQAPPRPIGEPFSAFADEVVRVMAENPGTQLMVFPELHLFGDGIPDRQRSEALQEAAQPLDGPLVDELRQLAGDLKLWLVPGSICERGPQGQLFNTSLVLSPDGALAASYRKIFPWRPFEPYDPGDRFVTVDLAGFARAGLSICYDAWFPEVTRQLAWMGADVIINVVKTTTPDRVCVIDYL
jgi:predicted amidohydrolase